MKATKPVAVAGIGCICAAGDSLVQCVDSLYSGVRHPGPPTMFSSKTSAPHPVFEIKSDFFSKRHFSRHNILRTCKLALTATLEALEDAGLTRGQIQGPATGVCIGTNVGSSMNNEVLRRIPAGNTGPYISPQDRFLMSNPVAGIAAEFGLDGPLQTVVSACSAGADALGTATSWINTGVCDVVFAGGADELYRVTYTGFKSLFINDKTPCKPFDAHRNGMNLGEGAAVFILVSDRFAKQHHLLPRAYILGYGASTDAYHFTKPRPDGKGLRLAIEMALAAAGRAPDEIAFVNAHGTGTLDNDAIESRILYSLLPGIPFLSTKGYTGHTLGASGAIEAAFAVVGLEKEEIPASIGFTTPDPELPAHPVNWKTKIRGHAALSQTLAFGGNNSVLILGKKEGLPWR